MPNNPQRRDRHDGAYIGTQVPGQSVLQNVNLLPGVFSNNDAYGQSGGALYIRVFDADRISVTQDGIPLNDSGNYAIYAHQQLDGELIERVSVNAGTTDVDVYGFGLRRHGQLSDDQTGPRFWGRAECVGR